MNTLLALWKTSLGSLLFAVGQFFAWLNRREQRQQERETNAELTDLFSAAAKPTPENAERLNRWLSRGRTGRLRHPPRSD